MTAVPQFTRSAEPNLTPMIDVLLVVIIVFMVAMVRVQRAMDVQLPEPCTALCGQSPPDCARSAARAALPNQSTRHRVSRSRARAAPDLRGTTGENHSGGGKSESALRRRGHRDGRRQIRRRPRDRNCSERARRRAVKRLNVSPERSVRVTCTIRVPTCSNRTRHARSRTLGSRSTRMNLSRLSAR